MHWRLAFALLVCVGYAAAEELTADKSEQTYFNSRLPLFIWGENNEELGRTPVDISPGVRIPNKHAWNIYAGRDEFMEDLDRNAVALAETMRNSAAPALIIARDGIATPVLKGLQGCRTLKRLNIGSLMNAEDFALIAGLPELEEFRGHLANDDGARVLAALPKLKSLKMYSSPGFTDAGLKILAANRTVETLELLYCKNVTTASLPALAAMPALRHLNIEGTGIAAEELLRWPGLKQFEKLATLHLDQPAAGSTTLIALRYALPRTRINYHPAQADEPSVPLQAEKIQQVETLIAKLGDDEFDVRERAVKGLFALGPSIEATIVAKLQSLKPSDDPEVRSLLQRLLGRLKTYDSDKAIAAELAELQRAVDDAPRHFKPGTAELDVKLKTKVSFDFVEVPLPDAIEILVRTTNAAIVLDPKVALESLPQVNLRVQEMNVDLAVEWTGRMVELETVRRGNVLVISTPQRIARLKLRGFTLRLPVGDGETPWTREETEPALEALSRHIVKWQEFAQPPNGIVAAGQLSMHIIDPKPCHEFLYNYLNAVKSGTKLLPSFNEELEKKLEERVTFDLAGKTVAALAELVNKEQRLIRVVPTEKHGFSNVLPADFKIDKMLLRDVVLGYAEELRAPVYPSGGELVFTMSAPVQHSFFVDAREALKTGVAVNDLLDAIRTIVHSHGGNCTTHPLRGRWAVYTDAWNGQRVLELLAIVAKTGKVPETLPAPAWFTKTLQR